MKHLVIHLEYGAEITIMADGDGDTNISEGVSIRELRTALESAQIAVNNALAEMEGNA